MRGRSTGKSSQRGETKRSQKGRIEQPVSAGGVVYRVTDGIVETVLCGRLLPARSALREAPAAKLGAATDGRTALKSGEEVRWSLAKGTPDAGETLEETALREVREETGLDVEMQAPIKSIDYWFADRAGDVRYHKTVHFYLMVPVGGDTSLHDPEFDVVEWFSSDRALEVLQYANEVQVLRQALELISLRKEGP
ncbi:MAG: NUDIX hydrolase [Stenotrophomonas maltophilia]